MRHISSDLHNKAACSQSFMMPAGTQVFKLSEGSLGLEACNQSIELSEAFKTLPEDKKVPIYQETSCISVNQIALASPVFLDRSKILNSNSTIENQQQQYQPIVGPGHITPQFTQMHSHKQSNTLFNL